MKVAEEVSVCLTAEEAKTLCGVIRKVWQLGGLAPGQQLSGREDEVWSEFAALVVALEDE